LKRIELDDEAVIALVRINNEGCSRGVDTVPIPAQIAHSANPAQRKINEILKTKGKEKRQAYSIPALGTIYNIDYKAHTHFYWILMKAISLKQLAACGNWLTRGTNISGTAVPLQRVDTPQTDVRSSPCPLSLWIKTDATPEWKAAFCRLYSTA
jgi:hypothetical protein